MMLGHPRVLFEGRHKAKGGGGIVDKALKDKGSQWERNIIVQLAKRHVELNLSKN